MSCAVKDLAIGQSFRTLLTNRVMTLFQVEPYREEGTGYQYLVRWKEGENTFVKEVHPDVQVQPLL